MTRLTSSHKDLSDEVTSAKAQLKNRAQVRYGDIALDCFCCLFFRDGVRLSVGSSSSWLRAALYEMLLTYPLLAGMPSCRTCNVVLTGCCYPHH